MCIFVYQIWYAPRATYNDVFPIPGWIGNTRQDDVGHYVNASACIFHRRA